VGDILVLFLLNSSLEAELYLNLFLKSDLISDSYSDR